MHRVAVIVLSVVLWGICAQAQFVAPGGVVPVVANLPGFNDTFWRSDVSILNVSEADTSVILQVFPEIVEGVAAFEPDVSESLTLAAGEQLTVTNVLQSRFQLVNTKGTLWVYSTDGTPLVISSRTYTDGATGGTYGQDVTSVLVADTAWASGLRHDGFYRTNVGVFWPTAMAEGESVEFEVTVYDSDGEEVGSGTIGFTQPGLQQYSLDGFGVDLLLDGYLVVTCSDAFAMWYAYASRVDQVTGDAVYRVARGYQVVK